MNAHPSGVDASGRAKWAQGESFPELLAFRPDLAPKEKAQGNGGGGGSSGGCDAGFAGAARKAKRGAFRPPHLTTPFNGSPQPGGPFLMPLPLRDESTPPVTA
ncbi:MAG: hypothetical protein LBQ36_02380 [Synergistaceae bacterium]|nr:hypothetical protein [Synergistaceae bacterium]